MFNRCSVMDLRNSIISAGFQANISRLSLSRSRSSIFPFSYRPLPMVTVCLGYFGWIDTLIPFSIVDSLEEGFTRVSATILHSAGTMVLLCSVTVPSLTGNLSISYGDRTTMKVIGALGECSASPSDNINDICPNGYDISPLNPKSRVVARVLWFLISGRSRLKQYSYKTSEAEPPSTYMRCMMWHPISTLVTIGLSCPSFSSGGNDISGFVEKL
ncbi:hypothetical protein Tco_1474201 [Tanacetum coccineum]